MVTGRYMITIWISLKTSTLNNCYKKPTIYTQMPITNQILKLNKFVELPICLKWKKVANSRMYQNPIEVVMSRTKVKMKLLGELGCNRERMWINGKMINIQNE